MHPFSRIFSRQFLFLLILFLVSMGFAFSDADYQAARDAESTSAGASHPIARADQQSGQIHPDKVRHSAVYYRIINTIWIAIVLVNAALIFFIMNGPLKAPSNLWTILWTFAYLAYLVHFYFAAGVLFGWNFQEIFHSHLGQNSNPEKVVDNPAPDLVLTVLWGIDVLLAWAVSSNPQWLRIERIAMSFFVMVVFIGATVFAAKAGPAAQTLGWILSVSVVGLEFLIIASRRWSRAAD